MSPKAQRIAIAEACGWFPTPEGYWTTNPAGRIVITHKWVMELPDYLADLNAMHEAEKALSVGQRIEYARDLCFIWTGRNDRAVPNWWLIHEATVAQRAEAFLRTLNLWDDSK